MRAEYNESLVILVTMYNDYTNESRVQRKSCYLSDGISNENSTTMKASLSS